MKLPNTTSKIPYLNIPDKPIVTTAQRLVPIVDISDDIVIFKDGGCAIIMESSSLNFGLLSEKEQQAVIYAYSALLNSLSFPIQILIRSQVKNIKKYMDYLEVAKGKIENPKLSMLMEKYKLFITETIKKRNVLGKRFYIIIPFSTYELGTVKSAASATRRKGPLPFSKQHVIKKAKIALYPKRDHLIRQSTRLGIRLKQLSTAQIIELYYNIYNSEPPIIRSDTKQQQPKKRKLL